MNVANLLADFGKHLLSAEQFKPGKGNYTRWGTFSVLVAIILFGMYSLYTMISAQEASASGFGMVVALGFACAWVAWRIINWPIFADFLIATQIEMSKVTWPSNRDLYVSTIAVIVNVVLFSLFLFITDFFWQRLLHLLGILKIGGMTDNMNM